MTSRVYADGVRAPLAGWLVTFLAEGHENVPCRDRGFRVARREEDESSFALHLRLPEVNRHRPERPNMTSYLPGRTSSPALPARASMNTRGDAGQSRVHSTSCQAAAGGGPSAWVVLHGAFRLPPFQRIAACQRSQVEGLPAARCSITAQRVRVVSQSVSQ
jgi:hypothetical protein